MGLGSKNTADFKPPVYEMQAHTPLSFASALHPRLSPVVDVEEPELLRLIV
jgi:hypothetical protein